VSAPRGRTGVIFLTVLVDLVGFGIILPILPYVATDYGAGGLGLGFLMGAFSGMQFLATAVLGRLSDRVGRRPVIITTTLINAVGYGVFALAGSYPVLLLARLISGFASGNLSVAQAYMADITPPAERSKGMGLLGAAFGIGFIVGPAIGGFAGHYGGQAAPALVAAGLSLANCVLAWRILTESLHAQHRSSKPLFDLEQARMAFGSDRLRPLMIVWFLVAFAFSGYTVILPLFAGVTWHWRERELGFLFTAIGLVAAVVQGGLIGRLSRRFGDRLLLIVGVGSMCVAIGAVPYLVRQPALFAWTVVLATGNSLFMPSATGMVSVLAGVSEQGSVLGVAQSLGALGRLIAPSVVGFLWDHAGSRTAFGGAALVMLGATLLATRIAARDPAAEPTAGAPPA